MSATGEPAGQRALHGVIPVARLQNKAAAGPGNVVVLIGAKTGRDGIGGVSVLASATFDAGSEQRRPSVQVGDPFIEKLLIEACLELYDAGLVVGIQDLGGAGLTCALSETAAAAGTGMSVNLDLVPLREPSMAPHEVLASESQERMLLIVTPDNLPVVLSHLLPLGRAGHRHRRGGRPGGGRRPAAHLVARRGRGRRAARLAGRRRARVRAAHARAQRP